MKVLVACEESQRVCTAFRELGHEAYSCDIQECSGGHPEWHILGDALKIINPHQISKSFYGIVFKTMDGQAHAIDGKWDLLIAHPPCTYLTNCCTRGFSLRCTSAEKVVERWENRALSVAFFMYFALADCDKICIENPVGFMSKAYKKPSQIIDPYQFADSVEDTENYVTKRTCLWLKGLQILKTNDLPRPVLPKRMTKSGKLKSITWEESVTKDRAKNRSKTFPGIARAMAEQWGGKSNESKILQTL